MSPNQEVTAAHITPAGLAAADSVVAKSVLADSVFADSTNITLTQLRYLVLVAETGSMTVAAREAFVAQSAVSMSIRSLERSLGVQLFVRQRSKPLHPTRAGADFLVRARAILAMVGDAIDAASPDMIRGELHAACFRTLAPFLLPELIARLHADHPGLRPKISEMTGDEVSAALMSRQVDVALTYDLGLDPSLRQEVLLVAPLHVALPEHHPLASAETVRLEDLADEPMVLLDMPLSREYFLDAFARRGLRPHVTYELGSFEAVRAMVARGHGYALLNQRPVFDVTYDGGRLCVRPLSGDPPSLDVVLASHPATRSHRKVSAFADTARAVVQTWR
ncbi:LysR family transcriptional regulator [soil metagenome]